MTDFEEIMNSGKIYKVMGGTNEDTHYYEYLQLMDPIIHWVIPKTEKRKSSAF